jgi:hypothetical protein
MTGCKFSSREAFLFDVDVKILVYKLKQGVGDSVRKEFGMQANAGPA